MAATPKKPVPMATKKTQEKAKMTAKTAPGKKGVPSKPGSSLASKIVKRAGTVAREGRDLVTAASSTAKAGADAVRTGKTFALKQNLKNLPKQVKEVGAAATKGKIGTPALETNTGKESRMKNQATVTQKPRSRKNYKG